MNNSMSEGRNSQDWGIALFLLVSASVIRAYGIGDWGLSFDEYFTYDQAHLRAGNIINPAYYFLVSNLFHMFGTSEAMARLPALVFACLSVPVFYLTWSSIIGRRAALLASILIVISTWHLWHSQFARFYSAVFFFASLSYYYFYRSIKEDSFLLLCLSGVFLLFAILFHATAALVGVSFTLFCLYLLCFQRDSEMFNKIPKIFLAGCLVVLIASFSYFFTILDDWQSGEKWGYNSFWILPQLIKYVQIPIGICAFLGLMNLYKKNTGFLAYVLVALIVQVLFLFVGANFMSVRPDYIYHTMPLIFVLAGVFLAGVFKGGNPLVAAGVSLLVVSSMLPETLSFFTNKKSLDIREPVAFMEREYKEGDKVVAFVFGLDTYSEREYDIVPYVGHPYDNAVNWDKKLGDVVGAENNRVWLVVQAGRKPYARGLERWLSCNTNLVWRKNSKRFDYEVTGFQVYLYSGQPLSGNDLGLCEAK